MTANRKMLMSLFYASSALLLFGGVGTAITSDNFYPFRNIDNGGCLTRSDDGFSTPVGLDSPFPFFESKKTEVFVNNNGILSFNMGVGEFKPKRFPIKGYELIAPFWADVDTTGTGKVCYRETSDVSLLTRAINEITSAFCDHLGFEPKTLFIATWYKVGYYRNNTCLMNTFQSILVTNGSTSFVIFNYAKGMIQWTTGDASGGRCGLGGAAAQVGFNAGDGVHFLSVPGSWTPEIINIASTSNVRTPGVWIFRVDEKDITEPDVKDKTPPPPPPPPCKNDISVTFAIEPRNMHMSLLGGTAMHLQGPCFTKSDKIKCMFEGKPNVTGTVLNNNTAICVSPTFNDVRMKSLTLFVERDDEEKKFGPEHFYPGYPHKFFDVNITSDQNSLPLLVSGSNDILTVQWDPHSLLPPLVDPNSFMVNIHLYELDFERKEWRPFLKFKRTQKNNGTAEFSVPESNKAEKDVYPIAVRISVGPRSPQAKTSHFFTDILKFTEDKVTLWKTDLFYADSLKLFDHCMNWSRRVDSTSNDTNILDRVSPCCGTKNKTNGAPNSGFVRDPRDELVAFLHPEAESCYIQETITSDNMGSGHQCCFDSDGLLIVGPNSGGTVDLVAPWGDFGYDVYYRHLMEDIIPAIYCCKGELQIGTCSVYYDRRPSHKPKGETCTLTRAGLAFGDPHIETLDGLLYTFNGLGEFVLIETVNDIFTLQGRMVQTSDVNGQLVSTSSFSAIVARQFDSDTVQFQLADSSDSEIDVLINGEWFDFEDLLDQQFNNVTLKKSGNDASAVFSTGVYINVKAEHGMISALFVSLPNSSYYWSQTSGLMGTYNNNTSDDFLQRGGTVPIPTTSSTEQIHTFGKTWIISRSEDSLFTYSKGEDWKKYYWPHFIPVYEAKFYNQSFKLMAEDTCHGDKCCLFDIAATGNFEIGKTTLREYTEFKEVMEICTEKVDCKNGCGDHGVCVKKDTCCCSRGFTGATCDIEPDEEDCDEDVEKICQDRGTCKVRGGSAICTCQDGFTGAWCESRIQEPNISH